MSGDRQLQDAILAELSWEPSVTAAHIGVTANAGVVTLTGHVESYVEKKAAETATRRVKGVNAVAENIEVRLPFSIKRSDEEIAEAALSRLAWDVSIPHDAVTVLVENGWVTLSGQVEWHYQHEAAEQDIYRLHGVVGVSNHMTIRPRVSAPSVRDDIMHALHRSWLIDPKTISVNADGGSIRLSGIVHSEHDRQVAGKAAWAAPGVTSVQNNLAVQL